MSQLVTSTGLVTKYVYLFKSQENSAMHIANINLLMFQYQNSTRLYTCLSVFSFILLFIHIKSDARYCSKKMTRVSAIGL
jgi:hypothetical protein